MMPQIDEKIYTAEDYWNLPEGERAELINGQLIYMSAPGLNHQRIVHQLSYEIESYIRSKNGDCEVIPAPFAVNLNANDKTYVEPDISVVCDKNKLTDRECKGAPDFIVEVVSPTNRRNDYFTKHALYFSAGVREYWIIDPEKERTTVYRYEGEDAPMIVPFSQPITVGIYGDLEITISELL